MVKLTCKFPTI